MDQTVKIFRLKEELNKELEVEIGKIMDELRGFFGINWVENVPKVFLLDSRTLIDLVRGHKTEDWEVGWSENRNIYLLDQNKFETESNHKKKNNEEYRALIKHELAHSFYSIKSGQNSNPRWLNEGTSIYISGQLEFRKRVQSFKNFLEFYNKVSSEIYTEAGWVVKLLVDKFGKEKLMGLLKQIKENKPADESFKRIFEEVYGIKLSYESLNKLIDPIDVSKLPYRKNIGCVVFKDDRFLLLHKPDWPENHWKFPQGGIDDNESDEDTAKRELLGQLGIDTFKIAGKSKNVRQNDWSEETIGKAGYRWKGQNQKFFLVEFTGKDTDIKLDTKEIGKYMWVTKAELLKTIDIDHKNFTGYKDTIEKILEEFKVKIF